VAVAESSMEHQGSGSILVSAAEEFLYWMVYGPSEFLWIVAVVGPVALLISTACGQFVDVSIRIL